MSKKQDKREEAYNRRMAAGGARRSFVSGQVLFEDKPGLVGSSQERITYLDRCNDARFLMSARLTIRDELRAVGNLYGGSVQLAELGHGNTFAQESVDGGKHGAGGGITPAMVEAQQIANIAQAAMRDLPTIRHKARSSKFRMGPHQTMTARSLVDPICVHGFDLTEVAMRFGWWVQHEDSGNPKIPKQQSQKLKAALVAALEAINEALHDHGIDARLIGVVKVR